MGGAVSTKAQEKATEHHGLHRKRIVTYNTFGIPFASPGMLRFPIRCVDEVMEAAEAGNWDNDTPTFVCMQETWAFKAGPGALLLHLIYYLEGIPVVGRYIQLLFEVLCALSAVLFPFILWNPKPWIALRAKSRFPYSVNCSWAPWTHGVDWSFILTPWKFLDSGLLILSNRPVLEEGFVTYDFFSGDDSMAKKGFLWARFAEADGDFLLINTHTQAWGNEARSKQLGQLQKFIDEKRKEGLKVYVCGDLNVDTCSAAGLCDHNDFSLDDLDLLGGAESTMHLYKLNENVPTCHEGWNLDHILSSEDAVTKTTVREGCSDHFMVEAVIEPTIGKRRSTCARVALGGGEAGLAIEGKVDNVAQQIQKLKAVKSVNEENEEEEDLNVDCVVKGKTVPMRVNCDRFDNDGMPTWEAKKHWFDHAATAKRSPVDKLFGRHLPRPGAHVIVHAKDAAAVSKATQP